MTMKQILKRLEVLKKRQAKVRDDLRDLLGEVEEFTETNEDAFASLQYAVDRLSERV